MAMEPWSFDKSLLVLRNYEGDRDIDSMNFQHTCFWVQIHNLLVDDGNNGIAKRIGHMIGVCQKKPSGSCSSFTGYH